MSEETDKAKENQQFELFAQVFNHEKPTKHLSNLISFWDSIPKYSRSRQLQASMRDENGRLPTLRHKFVSNDGDQCEMVLKPASITRDGKTIDYYPSESEELLEDIFLKILILQDHGTFNPKSAETWCRFTGNMILRELKNHGKERNYDEYKQSLEIMQDCKIEVIVNGTTSLRTSILPAVIFSDRERYLNDSNSMTAVMLSPAVSSAIKNYGYRQYNYELVIDMKKQLSRWLYKRIADRYLNAGAGAPDFRITYLEIKRDSGMLNQNSTSKQLSAIREALDELVANDCISNYDESVVKDKRTIIDATFRFQAKESLRRDIILANTRSKGIREIVGRSPTKKIGRSRLKP